MAPKAGGDNRSVSLIVSPVQPGLIVTMSAASVTSSVTAPLPEKIASLVHEARWLLIGLVGIYLALVLWGYDRADPGWSHAAALERVSNPGGRFGRPRGRAGRPWIPQRPKSRRALSPGLPPAARHRRAPRPPLSSPTPLTTPSPLLPYLRRRPLARSTRCNWSRCRTAAV